VPRKDGRFRGGRSRLARLVRPGGGGGGGHDNGDPTVDSVEPEGETQDTTVDITVWGTGFDQGLTVELEGDGEEVEEITTNSTTYIQPAACAF